MTAAVKPKKAASAAKAGSPRAASASVTPAVSVRAKAAAAPVEQTQARVPAPAAKAAKTAKAAKAAPVAAARPASTRAKSATLAPAEKAKKPATVRTSSTPVKLNKRSGDTIAKILATTEEIILQSGAERISILDVCHDSGISRGTFYRYFSSQDDLLDAFSRHKRDQFHAHLIEATAASQDPDERFQAVLGFIDDYLERSRARRLLLVAPEYATRWFQRIFHDSVHRFQDVLAPVFDAWEERRGIVLDRELIGELMVRFILSDVLVPSGADRRNLMRRMERFVVMLLSGRVARR
jgi:AcrR family transcriptional regulator